MRKMKRNMTMKKMTLAIMMKMASGLNMMKKPQKTETTGMKTAPTTRRMRSQM
jgi:hypothetical protein